MVGANSVMSCSICIRDVYKRQVNNSFTLYDGPAVWRTDAGYNPDTNAFDGDMSLGNFFPFDSASKVFDSIQTADKDGNKTNILSSSEGITNVGNAVKANHYMGCLLYTS